MTNWQSVQQAFAPDGMLRDIYVGPANVPIWNDFLSWVARSEYRIEFWHGESKKELPRQFGEIQHLQATDPTTLKLFLPNNAQINCHFFVEQEIEMDLDPKDFCDEVAFDVLLKFLAELSGVLRRRVKVTYENSPEDEIFVVGRESV